jgi:hypothetical protein
LPSLTIADDIFDFLALQDFAVVPLFFEDMLVGAGSTFKTIAAKRITLGAGLDPSDHEQIGADWTDWMA